MKTDLSYNRIYKHQVRHGTLIIKSNLETKLDAQVYRLNIEAPDLAHLVNKVLTVAPDHLPRLVRGAELVLENAVVGNGAPDTYYVTSSTTKNRIYKVHIPADDPDAWTCKVERDPYHPEQNGAACPDIDSPSAPTTAKGRKRCKHMAAAWFYVNRPNNIPPASLDLIVQNAELQDKIELRQQIEADRQRLEDHFLQHHPLYTLAHELDEAKKRR